MVQLSNLVVSAHAPLPTVTAIIPTYNRRDFVGRAVKSILNQSLLPDEIIVVDDGSTDGTYEALTSAFGDRIRIVSQANAGVSGARRRGLEEARGEWIAFLDSDDEWAPGRMEALLRAANRAPSDVPWIFGDTVVLSDGGERRDLFQALEFKVASDLEVFDDALATQFPFQFSLLPSSLVRRDAFLESEAFAEGLRSSEDFLASFRIAIRNRFAAIPEVVTIVYRTSDLKASSLDQTERHGSDYFMARILAFGEAAEARGTGPWGQLFENAVRGCCIARSHEGRPARQLSLRQFRHRVSAKSMVFTVAALIGPLAIRQWERLSRLRRPAATKKYALEHREPAPEAV